MQRILITGARGFAGRHLGAALSLRGFEVIASTADVRDADAVSREMRETRPDAVAHLAAITSVAGAREREREAWDVNAAGTLNVVLALQEHAPAARLLVASSAEVYGRIADDEGPVGEDRPVAPISPYALSKTALEVACTRERLDVVVVRPFPHTGPGQTETFAIPSFAGQIARIEAGRAEPVIKVGNLAARRDYTDVRDVVDAYAALLERRGGPRVLNVSTGLAHSMASILDRLLALAGEKIAIEVDPARLRQLDLPLLVGSPRRLFEWTGWTPTRGLDETLRDVLHAAREGASKQ